MTQPTIELKDMIAFCDTAILCGGEPAGTFAYCKQNFEAIRAALTAQVLPELPKCPKLTEKARQAFADHMQAAKVCGDDPHDALLASAMGTLLRFHDKYHAAIAAVAKDGAG